METRSEHGAKDEKNDEHEQTLDELVEELKRHPAFMTHYDETQPMSPALEGLQALMYESENNDDNAISFKKDGNKNFERGKYRWAIDNYTEGIKCKPTDRDLNAVLYTNRAAAQFRIGNFRSAFNDCVLARKFKVGHLKAIVRGAQCCMQMAKYDQALQWCSEALEISPTDGKMLELRTKADKLLREQECNKRREMAKERKQAAQEQKLIDAILKRGIRLHVPSGSKKEHNNPLLLSSLESHHPSGSKVTLDVDNILHWPVLFLYPEYTESDFIEAFDERSSFAEHLEVMFGNDRPAWDIDSKYTIDRLQIYFEERDAQRLHKVESTSTLLSILQNEKYNVNAGTPSFIVLVQQSDFEKQFLHKYKT